MSRKDSICELSHSIGNFFNLNIFQRVPEVIFVLFAAVSLSHSVNLHCDFRFHSFPNNAAFNVYTCFNPIITIDGNDTHVLSVTGTHLNQNNEDDVRGFFLNQNHPYDRMFRRINNFFPFLVHFAWLNGILSTLTINDLEQFQTVRQFNFLGNRLVSLDSDLFLHNPNLDMIGFGNNQISNVGIGLLDSVHDTTTAWFHGNPCIDMNALTVAAFQELRRILPESCPPLETTTTTLSTTTDSGQCPVECLELIETLKEEIRIQDEEIARHRGEITTLANTIDAQGYAIRDLEEQMREIWMRP